MSATLIMIIQFLFGLSIIVGLHEFGHMITAKLCGMRVEEFSIGFPPRIFSLRFGFTRYSFGAILLGGFVKISGMVDESLEQKNIERIPKPYEYRVKPAWQRLIVMSGGIFMNVITAIAIFSLFALKDGQEYISKDELNKYGIVVYEIGEKIGLKTGDKILNINGQEYDRFADLLDLNLLLKNNSYYTVRRKDSILKIEIPKDFTEYLRTENEVEPARFIEPIYRFEIHEIIPGGAADQAGLLPKDRVIAVDGNNTNFFQQYETEVQKLRGQKISITVEREKELITKSIKIESDGTIGFIPYFLIQTVTNNYTIPEAFSKGTEKAFSIVFITFKLLGKVISRDISFSTAFSGPIGIAKEFGGIWDWKNFFNLIGLLSMALAFMNLLPIPALDGGHLVFLSFELVSGRTPSQRFMLNAQKFGMLLILTLMVMIIFWDLVDVFT